MGKSATKYEPRWKRDNPYECWRNGSAMLTFEALRRARSKGLISPRILCSVDEPEKWDYLLDSVLAECDYQQSRKAGSRA